MSASAISVPKAASLARRAATGRGAAVQAVSSTSGTRPQLPCMAPRSQQRSKLANDRFRGNSNTFRKTGVVCRLSADDGGSAAVTTTLEPLRRVSNNVKDATAKIPGVANEQALGSLSAVALLVGAMGLVAYLSPEDQPLDALVAAAQPGWAFYNAALTEHPIFTKACTSGVVYALGDVIAQVTEGRTWREVDPLRAGRSSAVGFVGHGPLSHYWYIACDHFVTVPGAAGVAIKVAIDQTAWSLFWNCSYYTMLGQLKGDSLSTTWTGIRNTWSQMLTAGWKLWPFAHIVTYGLVPQELRLLWVDAVEILWVCILSTFANQEVEEEEGVAAEEAALLPAAAAAVMEGGMVPIPVPVPVPVEVEAVDKVSVS